MADPYDVIVVGARCAGSPTAMLLARKGYRVLVVDRSTFPSDTVSTHLIHAPGVAALERWGILDQIIATGCPPVDTYSFDFGPLTISGHTTARRRELHRVRAAPHGARHAPRRRRQRAPAPRSAKGSPSTRSSIEDGRVTGIRGRDRTARRSPSDARVVIGADGANSGSRRPSSPSSTTTSRSCRPGYYTYFADLPVDGFEITIRPDRGWAALPTNDGLTLRRRRLALRRARGQQARRRGQLPQDPRARRRRSPSGSASATRVDRFHGSPVPNFFRKPYGPGWALVGDAGYTKDPITAQGISNAFRDAELLRRCPRRRVCPVRRPFDDAMAGYQSDARRRTRCRCTSSRPSWRRSSRRRPSCSSCSAPSTATSPRWTPSSASPPGRCPRRVLRSEEPDEARRQRGSGVRYRGQPARSTPRGSSAAGQPRRETAWSQAKRSVMPPT